MTKIGKLEVQSVRPHPQRPGRLEVKAGPGTLSMHPERLEQIADGRGHGGYRGVCCSWETTFERERREREEAALLARGTEA